MSKIKSYRIKQVSRSLEHQACRYALSPLRSNEAEGSSDQVIMEGVASLVAQRRAAIKRLNAVQYRGLERRRDFVYAMNCPPVGVLTNQLDMMSCQRVPFCPFCWCRRYVTDAVTAYRNYLFPVGKDRPDVELQERRVTIDIPATAHDLTWAIELAVDLRRSVWVDELGNQKRKQLFRASKKLLGASQLVSLEPTESGWRIVNRRLLVIPSRPIDNVLPKFPTSTSEGVTIMDVARRTRLWYGPDEQAPGTPEQILVGAIGRFGRYPAELMNGNPIAVRNLLEQLAARRRRLMAHSGVIRLARSQSSKAIRQVPLGVDEWI